MRFSVCIEQDVPRFDVSMKDAVFMRVMHGSRHLCHKFRRLPDRHRCTSDCFVELTAFDEFHAEITAAITLAHLVDGDDPWMVQPRGSFCFQTKTLDVRFARPLAKANDF